MVPTYIHEIVPTKLTIVILYYIHIIHHIINTIEFECIYYHLSGVYEYAYIHIFSVGIIGAIYDCVSFSFALWALLIHIYVKCNIVPMTHEYAYKAKTTQSVAGSLFARKKNSKKNPHARELKILKT